MNPLTSITLFLALVLVVFGLIELHARRIVRKFEEIIRKEF